MPKSTGFKTPVLYRNCLYCSFKTRSTERLLERERFHKRPAEATPFFFQSESFPKGLAVHCSQFQRKIPSLQKKELTCPEVKVILSHLNRKRQTRTPPLGPCRRVWYFKPSYPAPRGHCNLYTWATTIVAELWSKRFWAKIWAATWELWYAQRERSLLFCFPCLLGQCVQGSSRKTWVSSRILEIFLSTFCWLSWFSCLQIIYFCSGCLSRSHETCIETTFSRWRRCKRIQIGNFKSDATRAESTCSFCWAWWCGAESVDVAKTTLKTVSLSST